MINSRLLFSRSTLARPKRHGDRVRSRERRAKDWVARLSILICVLMLVEGIFRKWLFPEQQQIFYFLRDPFVVVLYLYAASRGLIARHAWATVFLGFASLLSGLAVLQYVDRAGLVPAALAIRNYFLYLPMAFVLWRAATAEHLRNFVKLNIVAAIPMALLVAVQLNSPPDAFINKLIYEEQTAVTVIGDVVRPSGTFTFTIAGYAAFLAALFISAVVERRRLGLSRSWILVGAPFVLFIAIGTNNRGIWFLHAAIVLGLAALAMIAGNLHLKRDAVRSMTALTVGGFLIGATLLAPYLAAVVERHNMIREEEVEGGFEGRAVAQATAWFRALEEPPVLGYGVGYATAGVQQVAGGAVHWETPEIEVERIVFELGPLLGPAFILVRWGFACFLVMEAVRAARRGAGLPLVLAPWAAVALVTGQITFSTLNGYYAWVAVGFALAACRWVEPRHFTCSAALRARLLGVRKASVG